MRTLADTAAAEEGNLISDKVLKLFRNCVNARS
jgi:hypothetical protein